jgi:hypothetical protein
MRFLYLLLSFVTSACLPESEHPGCFEKHLRDAIKINEARRPLYSAATDGASDSITNSLLFQERLGLFVAVYNDRKAKPFQDQGVGILCDEFISMSEIPAFEAHVTKPASSYAEAPHLEVKVLAKNLQQALDQKDWKSVAEISDKEIAVLEEAPAYNCMLKHFLESVSRAAKLAPRHLAKAQQLGLDGKKIEALSVRFAQTHLDYLKQAQSLDGEAGVLQEQGVPILCRDVPHIPSPK